MCSDLLIADIAAYRWMWICQVRERKGPHYTGSESQHRSFTLATDLQASVLSVLSSHLSILRLVALKTAGWTSAQVVCFADLITLERLELLTALSCCGTPDIDI